MAATLAILVVGVLLALLVGVAVRSALDVGGRWLAFEAIPLGVATSIGVLYGLAYVLPMTSAAVVLVAAAAAVLVAASVIRARRRARTGDALRSALSEALAPDRADGAVIATGGAAALLALLPVFRIGFPTTLGFGNNDSWAYAGIVSWLRDNAWRSHAPIGSSDLFGSLLTNQLRDGFGFGFELYSSATASLTGRQGHEVVDAVAAVGFVVAAAGWAHLHRALSPDSRASRLAVAALGALSPLLLLPFSDNYTPQFFGLCLWPGAVAGVVVFLRAPGIRTLVPAALVAGGVIAVYPGVSPWLAVSAVLAAAAIVCETRRRDGLGRAARRVAASGAILIAAIVVAFPYSVRQTLHFVLAKTSASPVPYPPLSDRGYGVLAAGASPPPPLLNDAPPTWSATVTGLAVMLIALLTLVALIRRPNRHIVLLAIIAGVTLVTGVVLLQFRVLDPWSYGVYKTVITGGALGGGLLMVGLAAATVGAAWVRHAAVAMCVAVWLGTGADLLQAVDQGAVGFRAADVELGRALSALPPGSVTLVEGVSETGEAFHMRMTASYFDLLAKGRPVEGTGTTSTYFSPGDAPSWRPPKAWTHVLTVAGDGDFTEGRRVVWGNTAYRLSSAPVRDATPFLRTWYPAEPTEIGPMRWISGPVEVVLSNRAGPDSTLTLSFQATSFNRPRRLVVTVPATGARWVIALPANRLTEVAIPVQVPPGEARYVRIEPRPGAEPAPAGDPRRISVRIGGVSVAPG